ncbi:MAG: hypothetical protein WBC18_27010 [Ottowia sp.]|uniref:hypothetical protein n=1 Tax=Ottowia sp. TaxID=1898956 RepID=UPI003C714772
MTANPIPRPQGDLGIAEFASSWRAYCSQFGQLLQFDMVLARYRGATEALCFVRYEAEHAAHRLMRAAGAVQHGGQLMFAVDTTTAPDRAAIPAAPSR